MTNKAIGPSFPSELEAANLLGLPFSWGADGTFEFSSSMSEADIDAIQAIYEAHDPATPAPAVLPTLVQLQSQLNDIAAQVAALSEA